MNLVSKKNALIINKYKHICTCFVNIAVWKYCIIKPVLGYIGDIGCN